VSSFLVDVTLTITGSYNESSICETSVKTPALVNVCHPQTVEVLANEESVTSVEEELI
jgi:hypothetical protein